jgi:hypothetical protein
MDDGPGLRKLTAREKVERAFLRDGRLVSIPAKPSKRDLLLPVILDRCFPEDRDYEEKEVNMRLALLHADVAALRRYLVDGQLMTREAHGERLSRGRGPPRQRLVAPVRPGLSGARSTRLSGARSIDRCRVPCPSCIRPR